MSIDRAAFTTKNPTDRKAFDAHWNKTLSDESIIAKTIIDAGQVTGNILCFEQFSLPAVSYWIGMCGEDKGFSHSRG